MFFTNTSLDNIFYHFFFSPSPFCLLIFSFISPLQNNPTPSCFDDRRMEEAIVFPLFFPSFSLKGGPSDLGTKIYINTIKPSLYSQSLLIVIHKTPVVENHSATREIRYTSAHVDTDWKPCPFLAPLAVGQRAYVMVCCPSCVRQVVRLAVLTSPTLWG